MTASSLTVIRREVQLSHGTTRYYEAGAGEPVIFLHGSGIEQGADDFLPSFPALADHFRVVSPDLLGWPPSDTFGDIPSFPYLVDFLREFQDALGLRRSHLVGVSMGAWIAAIFAYESPQRVDKLVITGNPGLHGSPNRRMLAWQLPDEATVASWVSKVARVGGVDAAKVTQEKVAKMQTDGYADAFSKIMSHMGTDENRQRYAMERRLPYVEAETLYLWGKTDPAVDQAEVWHKLTPNSTLQVVDAGHRLHVDEPELFSRCVRDFLVGSA
jgi:pimeloyl-ACP methyl ester carboxylesterase